MLRTLQINKNFTTMIQMMKVVINYLKMMVTMVIKMIIRTNKITKYKRKMKNKRTVQIVL